MWRIDGERPRPLSAAVLPTKPGLEDFLEQDPSLLGTPLLVIGRQGRTPCTKFIDLLAIAMPTAAASSRPCFGTLGGRV